MQTLTELPKTTLHYREGSSDKVYQCQIEEAGDRYVVNFAYGRRGSTLNTGTKTNVPVDLDSAQRIFEKLVKEKKSKGYTEGESGISYLNSPQTPSGLLPQLLNSIEENEVQQLIQDNNWCAQEKFDGRRMLIRKQGDVILGINKKGLTIGLPLPVFDAVKLFKADLVLDGESIGDTLHVFDLLELDEEDLRAWPYRKRLTALMNVLAKVQQRTIRLVDTAFRTEQKQLMLNDLRKSKHEGIVFKLLSAPYIPGRPNSGGSQLKHKFVATLSAVVSKVNQRRSVEIRLLDDEGWQIVGNVTIPANHTIPGTGEVVEVQYLYAHRQSGVLYQPVYLGKRDDVAQEDCLRSQLKYKPDQENEA
jgi:bifunctional non-homologous end joining protein LigD